MAVLELIKEAQSLSDKEQSLIISSLLQSRANKDYARREQWAQQLDDPDKSRWVDIATVEKELGL